MRSLRNRRFNFIPRWIPFLVWVCGFAWPGSALADLELGPEFAISLPQTFQIGVEGYCKGTPQGDSVESPPPSNSFFCSDQFRGYLDLGGIVYPLALSDKAITAFSIETGVRYFLGELPFFVGFAFGLRNIDIKANLSAFQIDGSSVASSAAVSFTALYLGPLLGMKVNLGRGFSLEGNIGFQAALYASGFMYLTNSATGANSNNSTLLQVDSDVAMSRIAGLLLPSVTLVRLVRYF